MRTDEDDDDEQSPKSLRLRAIVRSEFKKNANVTDAVEVERLQGNAVRALTNYLTLEQLEGMKARASAHAEAKKRA